MTSVWFTVSVLLFVVSLLCLGLWLSSRHRARLYDEENAKLHVLLTKLAVQPEERRQIAKFVSSHLHDPSDKNQEYVLRVIAGWAGDDDGA